MRRVYFFQFLWNILLTSSSLWNRMQLYLRLGKNDKRLAGQEMAKRRSNNPTQTTTTQNFTENTRNPTRSLMRMLLVGTTNAFMSGEMSGGAWVGWPKRVDTRADNLNGVDANIILATEAMGPTNTSKACAAWENIETKRRARSKGARWDRIAVAIAGYRWIYRRKRQLERQRDWWGNLRTGGGCPRTPIYETKGYANTRWTGGRWHWPGGPCGRDKTRPKCNTT